MILFQWKINSIDDVTMGMAMAMTMDKIVGAEHCRESKRIDLERKSQIEILGAQRIPKKGAQFLIIWDLCSVICLHVWPT